MTMNGCKPVIFLEEAEIEYDLTPIDFSKKEQKSEWFLKRSLIGETIILSSSSQEQFCTGRFSERVILLNKKLKMPIALKVMLKPNH